MMKSYAIRMYHGHGIQCGVLNRTSFSYRCRAVSEAVAICKAKEAAARINPSAVWLLDTICVTF